MKKYILLTVSLAISSNILFAYDEGPELGTMFSTGNAHYYVVRDFDTPEKNTAFTRNVEIMRRYANAIEAIKTKIATLPDGEEKTSLSNRLKQAEDEFANNDKVMQKLYAFSVARKYRQETFESNICVPITKEELSNLRDADGKELDPLLITERSGNSFYRIKNLKGLKLTFYVFLIGDLFLIANSYITGTGIQPINGTSDIVNLLLLVIVCTIISNQTLIVSIKNIGSVRASVLGAMEPVTAVVVGLLVFGESLTVKSAIGMLIILAAVVIIILSGNRKGKI